MRYLRPFRQYRSPIPAANLRGGGTIPPVTKPLDIIVALSGGVDSAVAALRLVEAGHRVSALHMTNWEDDAGYCNAAEDFQDARRICQQLDIQLHRVNFSREYKRNVFAHFLTELEAGRTPNPDILCNREIKFGVFREHAHRLGADWIATGHYARIRHDPARLLRGVDDNKDQTYFLHRVAADQLDNVLFPVGELTKAEVREDARRMGLAVADKRDSTGICFIGERPFDAFLGEYLQGKPGPMATPEGTVVGEHRGLAFYTIGQRQGLGLGGDRDGTGEPWYVAAKDVPANTLVVVQGRRHPALFAGTLAAQDAAWIGPPPADGTPIEARIRHRQPLQGCRVHQSSGGELLVTFDEPQRAVTPGQAIVFYSGELCLGGATIVQAVGNGDEAPATPLGRAASR